MRALTSYYNVKASDQWDSDSHPWRHLLRLAKPSDFVVVKLDIDHPELEASLVRQVRFA